MLTRKDVHSCAASGCCTPQCRCLMSLHCRSLPRQDFSSQACLLGGPVLLRHTTIFDHMSWHMSASIQAPSFSPYRAPSPLPVLGQIHRGDLQGTDPKSTPGETSVLDRGIPQRTVPLNSTLRCARVLISSPDHQMHPAVCSTSHAAPRKAGSSMGGRVYAFKLPVGTCMLCLLWPFFSLGQQIYI